jgi:coenzyme PQQ precursor peptide PqqA
MPPWVEVYQVGVRCMKKTWKKPAMSEKPAGMEVTAYLPAEI